MLKKLLMFITMLYASIAFAAVDVNQANAAELDSIKGIGPAISGKIIEERKKGTFKDWSDLLARVNGIGPKSAANFSKGGLTVGGTAYSAAAVPAPAPKPMAAPKAPVTPAAPATPAVPTTPAAPK